MQKIILKSAKVRDVVIEGLIKSLWDKNRLDGSSTASIAQT